MSGRLSKPIGNQIQSFPIGSWEEEFEKASKCGFELIEWIFDIYEQNPIMNQDGINKIKYFIKQYDVQINSICADYFMINKLFDVSEYDLENNLSVLQKLIQQCHKADIKILEIPLVDSSSIKNKTNEDKLVLHLEKILDLSQDHGVQLTLETDLPPILFKDLLLKFNHPVIKANYDIGNSTSLGFDMKMELETLQPWIVNIHVKDRIKNGTTVPLGTGDANFDQFFQILNKIDYKNDLIIQGAREDLHNSKIPPEITCKKYLEFVKQYVDKYLII